ncbi:hypothetical protein TEA_004132 [Camellia sinensis var. sinensis]|uniref:Plastid lipid-associated protein/fibrillin conserved domain-containing protein n=1 Tax=Camellia sinensis var. sinensis TaxID=542762 RepID=A0A4S4EVY2_CAMSN|nr:hypothetical protein TEA_004132 [Camellia sinensis var. sinensis]
MAMAPALSSSSSSSAFFFSSSTTWRGLVGPEISKQLLNLSRIAAMRPSGHGWGSHKVTKISALISSKPKEELRTKPDELVNSILSIVTQIDRGVLLTRDEHNKVAEMAQELGRFCVDEPVKCPLIFGEWDVVYCFVSTSPGKIGIAIPGGGYKSAFGRLVFKTKEMIQFVKAPNTVRNRVSFSVFGFLDGEVSLEGKLKALDESAEVATGSYSRWRATSQSQSMC